MAREKTLNSESNNESYKEPRRESRSELVSLLLKVGITAAVIWVLLTYFIGIYAVHTNDMYPAVRDGDLLITWKPAQVQKGAIVSYVRGKERKFGRIAGVAGDIISISDDGRYTVNGEIPYETIYYDTRSDPSSDVVYPYTVPDGMVFVLNDLRDNISDSRSFGAVDISDVDGSAALLLRRRSW